MASQHLKDVTARLKENKNAKDEDILTSLQMVSEMLARGYEFLPIELGKVRGKAICRGRWEDSPALPLDEGNRRIRGGCNGAGLQRNESFCRWRISVGGGGFLRGH